jgi:hypothetical protein
MLNDVVLDACIFGHAQNPGLGVYFVEASRFLDALINVEAKLCLDGGVASGSSRILAEYRSVIAPTSLAAALLASMLSEGRYVETNPRVSRGVRQCVNRLIAATKAMDRLYVCVACNSREKVLVTHDHEDFPDDVRERIADQLQVSVLEAVDAEPLLSP